MRDVPHEQLLGVGVSDHSAALGLPLLPLPDWMETERERKPEYFCLEVKCLEVDILLGVLPGLGPLCAGGGPPGLCSLGLWSLCGLCVLV